jgi:hypothetical protein
MNAEPKTDDWICPTRFGTGHGVSLLPNDHRGFGAAVFLGRRFFERQPRSHLRRWFSKRPQTGSSIDHENRSASQESWKTGILENWKWLHPAKSSWLWSAASSTPSARCRIPVNMPSSKGITLDVPAIGKHDQHGLQTHRYVVVLVHHLETGTLQLEASGLPCSGKGPVLFHDSAIRRSADCQ